MADIIIHNAKVYVEQNQFAEAVLVRDGKIAAVGTSSEILTSAHNAEKIDAQGNLLLPGFNDSHLHLHDFGRNLHRIDAHGVASIEELIKRGRELIDRLKLPKGSVVVGSGWNEELFSGEKRLPNRHDMDRISTEHAVIVSRVCGHSLCCNTLAMEMAGVTRNSRFEKRGEIELDAQGEPLGIFGEGMALYKIRKIIPSYNQEQIEEHLLYAMRHALANGLTSVGSMDVFGDNYQSVVDAYIKLFSENDLHLRVNLQCLMENDEIFSEFIKRGWITKASMGHPYLTMGASKLFADGSLGSRTAFMRKAYRDDPSTCGFQRLSQETLDALVRKNHENGFQVIVHAIGDAAIDEVISSFEKVIGSSAHGGSASNGCKNNLRHGVMHCQITDLPLLQRMAHNDILAFVQPIFLTHDLYVLENRVGKELATTSYAFATMKKLGIKTSYGTDSPVESMSPIECIDCVVNLHAPECVDVYTAVDAYTTGSAYAEFTEDVKGRIKAGFFADMTLLDKDIFAIPKKEISTAQVLWTMVGGKMAYQA